jgi:hypothetical protein
MEEEEGNGESGEGIRAGVQCGVGREEGCVGAKKKKGKSFLATCGPNLHRSGR